MFLFSVLVFLSALQFIIIRFTAQSSLTTVWILQLIIFKLLNYHRQGQGREVEAGVDSINTVGVKGCNILASLKFSGMILSRKLLRKYCLITNSIKSVGWAASLQLKRFIVCVCTAFHKFSYLGKWFKIILSLNYQSFLALLWFIFNYIPISCLPYLLKKIFHLYLQCVSLYFDPYIMGLKGLKGRQEEEGKKFQLWGNTNTADYYHSDSVQFSPSFHNEHGFHLYFTKIVVSIFFSG